MYLKRITLISLSLFMHSSCIKEEVGHTNSIIKNDTNFTVKLLPYKNGTIDYTTAKTILPNSEIKVFDASVRGKNLEPSFGILLQPYDSIVVTYNDTVKIAHIRFNLLVLHTRKIDFSNSRNISNSSLSWIEDITNETKYSVTGTFTYTFTYNDYLNAL
jgi:hypothetical protein